MNDNKLVFNLIPPDISDRNPDNQKELWEALEICEQWVKMESSRLIEEMERYWYVSIDKEFHIEYTPVEIYINPENDQDMEWTEEYMREYFQSRVIEVGGCEIELDVISYGDTHFELQLKEETIKSKEKY